MTAATRISEVAVATRAIETTVISTAAIEAAEEEGDIRDENSTKLFSQQLFARLYQAIKIFL